MPKNKTQKQKTLGSEIKNIPSEVKYIALWILILVGVFFLFNYIFNNLGTINYDGLKFSKETIGKIEVYHYYYLYKDRTGQLVQNNIYLRNNPTENQVPVSGNVTFIEGSKVFLGIDTDNLTSCNTSSIAISEITSFIVNGGISVKGGTVNNATAVKQNLTYVDCNVQKQNPVITIGLGNTTAVVNKGLCYKITAATCNDLLPAAEKFIVKAIVDAKDNATVV
jgi:hypothetical protein